MIATHLLIKRYLAIPQTRDSYVGECDMDEIVENKVSPLISKTTLDFVFPIIAFSAIFWVFYLMSRLYYLTWDGGRSFFLLFISTLIIDQLVTRTLLCLVISGIYYCALKLSSKLRSNVTRLLQQEFDFQARC